MCLLNPNSMVDESRFYQIYNLCMPHVLDNQSAVNWKPSLCGEKRKKVHLVCSGDLKQDWVCKFMRVYSCP